MDTRRLGSGNRNACSRCAAHVVSTHRRDPSDDGDEPTPAGVRGASTPKLPAREHGGAIPLGRLTSRMMDAPRTAKEVVSRSGWVRRELVVEERRCVGGAEGRRPIPCSSGPGPASARGGSSTAVRVEAPRALVPARGARRRAARPGSSELPGARRRGTSMASAPAAANAYGVSLPSRRGDPGCRGRSIRSSRNHEAARQMDPICLHRPGRNISAEVAAESGYRPSRSSAP
jgi:hypothetical protein